MAVLWLAVGMLGFLAWKGSQAEEELLPGEPSRVAQVSMEVGGESDFRVLVPIANPDERGAPGGPGVGDRQGK